MRLYKIVILIVFGICEFSFAGGSQSGGSGFLYSNGEVRNQAEVCYFDECYSLHQASLEITEGRFEVAEALIRNYRPELTAYFNEIRPEVKNSNSAQMKSSIHQSIRATILNNYGGYGEGEAIEAVVEAPEEAEAEVRQIIYSL